METGPGSVEVAASAGGRTGFQLDLNLCTGCQACVVACTIENQLPWGTSWRWVDTFNESRLPGIPVHHLSLACNHCEDAPCAAACPAVAYERDPVTGAVLLDGDKCIGCRYCTWACPYDAPKYDPTAGVVSKCTFCNSRQLEGLTPACANQCPTGALRVGPLDSLAGTPEAPGFPRTPAGPSIRFAPLREGATAPDPEPAPVLGGAGVVASDASKTSFRSEAPLWVFSLIVSVLVGVMATPLGRDTLPWWLFLSAAFVAAGASTMHLGRPSRAWRAVLGWRTSWLSREILFFNAFTVVGTLELLGVLPGWVEVLGAGPDTAARATGAAVALVGFATLFSIDRVYTVTHTPGLPVHSARTVATGLMVSGLVAGVTPLWVGILALKLLSYGARKHREVMSGGVWSRGVSSARVATTLAGAALLAGGTPVSTLLLGPDGGAAFEGGAIVTLLVGVGLLLVGGAIDRAEFYRELRVITPAGRIAEDLRIAATPEG